MYKNGKIWCVTAITAISLGLSISLGSIAHADMVPNNETPVADTLTTGTPANTNSLQGNDNSTGIDTQSDNQTPVKPEATENKDVAQQTIPETGTPNTFPTINNNTYYYNSEGQLVKNNFYSNWGQTYYFQPNGARLDNGFYNNWGNTYYFGADGARWDNRYMVRWGNAYYFGNDGALIKNKNLNVNGKDYWVNNQGIIPLRNQFLTANDNQLYYFDANNSLITNKFYHNWGNAYYFGADGARYTNQFLTRDGKVYYFDNDGVMYQDRYYKNWGNTYYFGADGARYTNQFLTKDGKVYYFDNDGAMYQNRYYKNWGNTYYFGADGTRYTNQFLTKDGKVYYFDNDGVMYQNRYYKNWGNTYYFGADGARYTNQFLDKDDSNTHIHYFDSEGRMLVNQWLMYEGSTIYFDENGYPVTGKQDINGQNYLFNEDGALIPNGINRVNYTQYLGTLVGLYQNADWFKDCLSNHTMYYGKVTSGVNDGYSFISAKGDPTSWFYFKEIQDGQVLIKYVDPTTATDVAHSKFVEKAIPLKELTAIYNNEQNETLINDYANKLVAYR